MNLNKSEKELAKNNVETDLADLFVEDNYSQKQDTRKIENLNEHLKDSILANLFVESKVD